MDTGKNQEITNEIFKQLGLNGPGSVSLESSQPTPGQSEGERDQQKGRDAGKRRQKGKKTSAGRSEDLAWVLKEARIEQSLEKRGGEYKPSPEILKYLEGKYIFPLAERSVKFPRARWFCRLTEYHCDNITKCLDHISEPRYQRLARMRELDYTLNHLPSPAPHHIQCLDILLDKIWTENGLSETDMKERQAVAESVDKELSVRLAGCRVSLYGSSLTGFGLKLSNINLDLSITDQYKPHLALMTASEVLKNCSEFHSVTEEFHSKIPTIKFMTHSNLQCELSLNNSLASQTSRLLRDYNQLDGRVRVLGVAFRYWASLVRLDRQAEGSLPPHAISILLVYFLQQHSVLPCIHHFLDSTTEEMDYATPEEIRNWVSPNQQTPAELWIDLFKFFSITFKSSENVVSIRKAGLLSNEEKQWKSKRLAIEDPFSSKRSLCRSIQSLSVYDYITDCLKTGYLYFGTSQTSLGPLITRIVSEEEGLERVDLAKDITLESWLEKKGTVLTQADGEVGALLVPRNMIQFEFSSSVLLSGPVLAPYCVICGREGQVASSCPEETLPPLAPLPPLTRQYEGLLSKICVQAEKDWRPKHLELQIRDKIMDELNFHIRKLWPNARLFLFGSSNNGFAFKNSDLDISLTFEDKPDSSTLDSIQLIEELGENLKKLNSLRNVLAITSAKVPIVKMYHYHARLEADISLYNVLAQENTRMLAMYSDLDAKCHVLGYMVKLFAKICDIGDASRGSLSSYAYILMMIFYLQKVEPPVLPVLQEMYDEKKPENMVDGWNAWFCQDPRRIRAWPGWGRNKMSIAQLWIGFLDFFAGSWDDRTLVVSIRQSQNLTKFEKMWLSPCIAIEDPFELSHNLGAGVSRKMNLYIKKAFIRAREVFGSPVRIHDIEYLQDYLFDKSKLTDGAPPNDRGCRACGKIGHLVADCPRKRAADTRKRENRENRERLRSETGPEGSRSQVSDKSGGSDIRSEEAESAASEKEIWKKDKKEIKRLERKRKKLGKLCKEENVALDLLYQKRKNYLKNKPGTEEKREVAAESVPSNIVRDVVQDEFDEHFDYNTIESVPVKTGEILDYLTFSFEEENEEKRTDSDDKFDYNSVQAVWNTEGAIDYTAPVPTSNSGANNCTITIESSSEEDTNSSQKKNTKSAQKKKPQNKKEVKKVAHKSYEIVTNGKKKNPKSKSRKEN